MLTLGKLDKLGMVMPLGKVGGLTPLGREPSRAGMVGNLGRVPGISAWMMEGSGSGDRGGGAGRSGKSITLMRKQED